MKKVGKEKQKNNFTKLTHKKGISLIVLAITIIVIIILAAAVILIITKNNPVSSAKRSASVRNEWKEKIAEEVEGVPIPKGFTYKEGTKDTGLVIQDEKGNEFVWVPATKSTYVKDTSFPGSLPDHHPTGDDTLPNGITNETADVKKYGGFYIGRYEAGVPENQTTIDGKSSTSNVKGVPVSKKDAIVWTRIDYTNAKANAEGMISTDYVQTGLLTGKAWDTTCYWIEDSLKSINESATLTDSRYYGNYCDSLAPANENSGTKRTAGFNEKWKVKNIYDLAGNVFEWTSERASSSLFISRGSSFNGYGSDIPVSYRYCNGASITGDSIGFRSRLYIK